MSDFTSETDTDKNESVEGTVEQLSETIDEISESDRENKRSNATTDEAGAPETMLDESAQEVIDQAEGTIESLFAGASDGTVEETREDIDDLQTAVEEAVELLETVDLTEVLGAIEYGDVNEAIDVGEIPEAISKGDMDRAIRYSKLLMLVEFEELFDAVDVRSFRQNKNELETAVDEFTADRDEDDDMNWIVFDALKWLVESSLEDGENGDEGIVESMDMDDMTEVASDQMTQAAMQSKLRDTVEELRENIFDAHERMKKLRETANEQAAEATSDIEESPSRNPAAYSTMPAQRDDRISTVKFSTVPKNTRYSTAANPPRIYGTRFETRRDDDE